MAHYHAAVWLDHNEAKVFFVDESSFEQTEVHSPKEHTQLHRYLGNESGHRAEEDQTYYHAVAKALADAGEILIVGPATAKLAFLRHVAHHDREIEKRIIGVETVDHPSDKQLVAHVRKYFKEYDRMHKS